jgi:hypothetical protein
MFKNVFLAMVGVTNRWAMHAHLVNRVCSTLACHPYFPSSDAMIILNLS